MHFTGIGFAVETNWIVCISLEVASMDWTPWNNWIAGDRCQPKLKRSFQNWAYSFDWYERAHISSDCFLWRRYRVFRFEVSVLAPRLDLGSKSQQILTPARARSIWDFQLLGVKAITMPIDFFWRTGRCNLYAEAHQKMTQRPTAAYLSLKGMSAGEIHDDIVVTLGPDAVSCSSVTRYLREAWFPPSKHNPIPPTFKEISMIQIRLF
jgi:hypothetical protein